MVLFRAMHIAKKTLSIIDAQVNLAKCGQKFAVYTLVVESY